MSLMQRGYRQKGCHEIQDAEWNKENCSAAENARKYDQKQYETAKSRKGHFIKPAESGEGEKWMVNSTNLAG